ncbi:hypothetical protein Forpe1208_v004939 [Fusarium oxysporum f. sp. rapae]|uniref:Uncharacterized protein n=1 Tax=Fusarium oxysporum f. sp. rapae TaxID=485398 RepID=A0A8J5UET3_FUSOX|nr:hypothetical protein Forpe1208_v004939 [Fusarium oxysporum f. sp. rapae]
MEDPWGSPWTNDEPPKIDLPAPPPHAHFTADHSGSSQRVSPAHTPWNEDDDAWGGWAEAGKDSSPRWGRSPGLRPIGGSPAGSRLPSPTPDPWGRSPTFDTARLRKEDNGDSAISLGEGLRPIVGRVATRTPSPARSLKENAADIWQQPDPALSNRSLSPLPIEDEGRPESPGGVPRPALQRGTRPPALRQPSNKVSELVEMYDDMAKSSHSASPIDPSMRKVSDNASVQDVTIDMKVDEPDGIEEELQAKVEAEEELKEESNEKLEIGLEEEMEAEVEEKPKLQPEPDAKVEIVSEETLDQDENVMENGIAESPKDEDQGQTDSDSWSDFESPMKEARQDEAKQPEVEVSKEQPTATTDTASHEEASKEAAPAPPKPPSEQFAIDMTKLDDIFPSIETSFPSPEPIPDVIIDDSFTSISERKAWYLMSRPGSMRKHNLGGDENYVRVGWGNSQVREQAIRIVRRWMEEDSITGRVVLGRRGGAAGAKIFNWDSSAPSTEISISELLARKNHSRQASAASKGTVASPTAAAFGWGSNTIPSPTVAAPSSAPRTSTTSEPRSSVETSPVEATKTSPVSKTKAPPLASPPRPRITEEPPSPIKPTPLKPTNRPISITQPLHFPASPTISEPQSPLNPPPFLSTNRPVSVSQAPTSPLAQPPTNAGWGEDDDDDDDWGDMVSSPTAETNGGFTSMDAIVDSSSNDIKDHTSQPSTTAQSPLDDMVQSAPQSEIVTNGRPSTDTLPLPPQSSAPNHAQSPTDPWNISALQGIASSHSRSTTVDLTASPVKSLIPNHSRSTTIDLGTPRSPLASLASANLISNKAKSPIEQANKVNTWDSWGLGLLDDSNKPVRPKEDGMFASQQLQAPTPVDTFKDMASPKKPRPVSLPVPPRQKTVVESFKDDEIVANILRDLPDLSYMLR